MDDDPDLFDVEIARRREEAEGIISIELIPIASSALPQFEAGSHVDVQITPEITRQYSLCNDPRERHRYLLGILRETNSRGGSEAIHTAFLEGQHIKISHPKNNFKLVEAAGHTILAGGGIGITPILAMGWRLHALGASFELHYCTRSLARTAFQSILEAAPFADKMQLHLDDRAEAQRFDINRYLVRPGENKHLYVCGPFGFMTYVLDGAQRLGWLRDHVHSEYFAADVDTSGGSFIVRTARTGLTLTVPADRTLAEMLIENGVAVALSCEQGVCGTCLTKVLEGLPDHRDVYLSDPEKAANDQMTPCCSRAKSATLILDI
jgi:vanillate O-demethylase ferredoxin subunit